MQLDDLHGTWALENFMLDRLDGSSDDWGQNMVGLLLYAPTGHMSVSINRAPDLTQLSDGQLNFDASLFYAGTYSLVGETIYHKVTLASNLSRVGKELLRHAHLENNLLTLVGPKESFGTARLIWRKVQ